MRTHILSFGPLVFAILVNPLAGAQEMTQTSLNTSPYFYSGRCQSQGIWTQTAMTHSGELRQLLTKMKDNPACQSLKESLNSNFQGMERDLEILSKLQTQSGDRVQQLHSLPHEISSLRSFARDNSPFRNNIFDLLIGKTITLSALSSGKAKDGLSNEAINDSLSNLRQRMIRSTSSGLSLLNSSMLAYQQAQAECLDDKQGVLTGSILSGFAKTLAAFASSDTPGIGGQLATAIQNFNQYISRDKKYIEALRKLNDREYITSMSCLLEVTSDNYCSALDGQFMFKEILNNQNIKKQEFTNTRTGKKDYKIVGVSENFEKRLADGPMAGYYILSRQLPIITDWIQKVQYGITPQLPTEADFQISVSRNVYEHYNTLKTIEGAFNFQSRLLRELPDFKTQQTYVMQMVLDVSNAMLMTGSGMGGGGGRQENFFQKVSSENEILFRLLGIPVPPEVLGNGTGVEGLKFTGDPRAWLQAKYRTLPIFSDPIKLAERISENMQGLFREATNLAIAYYNKYFIVDKTQVVNDSLLGMDANVRDSLVNIDGYLENLEEKVKNQRDTTILGSIRDTRGRIGQVLARYKAIYRYGQDLVVEMNTAKRSAVSEDRIKELDKRMRKLGDGLLQEVYKQFEILTARTGFLSNRLSGFVLQDYTMSLRNRDQFNQYFEDLMLSTGYNSLNTMMNMSQTSYSNMKTDMDSAMNINKINIDSLEEVVRDVFVRSIFKLQLMATGRELTQVDIDKMVVNILKKTAAAELPGEESNALQREIRSSLYLIWQRATLTDVDTFGSSGFWDRIFVNPSKYVFNSVMGYKGKIVSSPVSEFATAYGEMAKLCTQTLAFSNLRPYWALCSEARLMSPLMKDDLQDDDLKSLLENYLSVQYLKKGYEHREPGKTNLTGLEIARNYQARICALRDYHRRNEVARITSSMRTDGDQYENPFTKIVEEIAEVSEAKVTPVQEEQDPGELLAPSKNDSKKKSKTTKKTDKE